MRLIIWLIIIYSLLLTASSLLCAETIVPISLKEIQPVKSVKSWKELRDYNVVKQQYDYSCGSGALATLMKIRYNDDVTEEGIINIILKNKSDVEKANIIQNGYSLLDLKRAAEARGYIASMYKIKTYHLNELKGPVIIYFEPHGEKHFAVFKQIRGNKIYLADPARGNIRMNINKFEKEWPGIILAIDR